jgi:hypothetical protein
MALLGNNGQSFERCDPNDPDRCNGPSKTHGQCPFKAAQGSKYCPRHGGNKAIEAQKSDNIYQYRLGKYQARHREFTSDPQIKNLRQEIGVLRMLLEEVFSYIEVAATKDDRVTLLITMPRIQSLITTIGDLVMKCDKIETKMGQTLDRASIMNIGSMIINVISQHVSDETVLDTIASEIVEAISNQPAA